MDPKPPRRSFRPWLRHLPAAALALSGIGLGLGLAASERNPVAKAPAARAQADQARVIVQYKRGASLLRTHAAQAGTQPLRYAQALAARHGLPLRDGRLIAERMQLVLAEGLGSAALAARLAADPDVEWAVVDGRRHALAAPNDPLYPAQSGGNTPAAGQWYLRPNSGLVQSSVDVEPAWDQARGNGVVVAVLDTGITSHPDLANQVLPGYDFVGYAAAEVAEANDGDLDDPDPADPGDWITDDENDDGIFDGCEESNSSWHGTQVAGLVAAETGNGAGMASVAPDARVLPVRVLGKCGGYDSDIIPAMRWAAGLAVPGVPANPNPAQVLNLSLGYQSSCGAAYTSVVAEINAAGTVVVAAAGNDGVTVGAPANCPGVLGVAGLRHVGTKVGFSDLGLEVAVSAPGGNCVNETGPCLYPLLSTTNTGVQAPQTATYTDSYDVTLGTSFSSPLVAGTAALMLSANPALTPAQVASALKSSARAFPTTGGDSGAPVCQAPSDTPQDSECYCTTNTCGAGMLDADGAVARALTGPFPALSATATAPAAGTSVTLSAAGSSALAGRSVASRAWTITQGAGLAEFVGATNGTQAVVHTTGAGVVEVQLTVTDSAGTSASLRQRLDVAATALAAVIGATPTAPEAGDNVVLDGSASMVDAGRTITAYLWEITAGADLASFSGATNTATALLQTSGAGTVTARLTVTDSAGVQASTERTLTIAAADSGGGGGGGLGAAWGLGLLLAAAALRRRPRG
jgi:serine protease